MNLKKISQLAVILGIISTGIAGLFFNVLPIFSTILIIFGILTGIFLYFKTESSLIKYEQHNKIVAKMMSSQGFGNPYAQEYFYNMFNLPQAKDPEQIKNAFEIDPNDESAVSLYCVNRALELSFVEWQGKIWQHSFKKDIDEFKKLLKEKMAIFPYNSYLFSAQGIIYDIEGQHELARQAFKKWGLKESHPFWRVAVATSYLKEGLYDDALKELEKANQEGLENINYHFGKVYQEKGDYKKAEKCFRDALKYDSHKKGVIRSLGWKAQALDGISFNLYFQGKYIQSCLWRIKSGIYLLLKKAFKRGLIEILDAVLKITIRLIFLFSKLLMPIYERFPSSRIISRKLPPDRFEYILGNQLLTEKQHYKAASHFLRKSLDINQKLENPFYIAINSLHLGICYLVQGVFLSETESLLKKSLVLFEELGDKQGIAKTHWMLSEYYKINNNISAQKLHQEESQKCFKEMGLTDKEIEVDQIIVDTDTGEKIQAVSGDQKDFKPKGYIQGKNIYDDLVNLSLDELEKYFIPFEEDFKEVPGAIVVAYNNMAQSLMNIGEHGKAEMLYLRALKHCSRLTEDDDFRYASILNNLAGVYFEQKEFDKVIEKTDEAKSILEKIDTPESKELYLRIESNIKKLLG